MQGRQAILCSCLYLKSRKVPPRVNEGQFRFVSLLCWAGQRMDGGRRGEFHQVLSAKRHYLLSLCLPDNLEQEFNSPPSHPAPAPCLKEVVSIAAAISSILPSPDRSLAAWLLLWGQSGAVREWGTAKLSCHVFVFINKISAARIGNNLCGISSRTPDSLHYLTDVIKVSPARLAS